MAKTEKSKAELYREERKQRIASAAKKNAKKSRRHPNAGKVIGKIVGIILIVAVVCGIGFVVLDQTGVIARSRTALTIGTNKISVAEYGYMYYMQYQSTINQAQQSEQSYGYNIYGFDYTKAPEEQDSPNQDDDGNTITWAEQLKKNTITYLREFYSMYSIAVKEGCKPTEENLKDIDEQIESMRQTAAGDGSTSQNSISMSLNSYLKLQYGKGITENFMRRMMEKEMIVQQYSTDKQQSFEDKYTDEEVDKEYKEDTTLYDVVNLRMYKFTPETLVANEGESEEALAKRQEAENAAALKKAEDLLAKATDEESFKAAAEPYIEADEAKEAEESGETTVETAEKAEDTEAAEDAETAEDTEAAEAAEETEEEEKDDHDSTTKVYGATKQNLSSTISEDAADWIYKAKAGAKKAFAAADNTAYAVYVVEGAHPQESVDVRHILFMTVDSETQEPLSEEEIKEKKAKCDEVLAEWNALEDKTEEAFAELATNNTEDTGSAENGGLYERVTPGQMVDSFDSWIFDTKRKEGDVEVVESEYGYHIMYYVGNRDLAYRYTIRTANTQNDYSSWLESELAEVVENPAGMAAGYKRADKLIQQTVKYIQSQQSSAG